MNLRSGFSARHCMTVSYSKFVFVCWMLLLLPVAYSSTVLSQPLRARQEGARSGEEVAAPARPARTRRALSGSGRARRARRALGAHSAAAVPSDGGVRVAGFISHTSSCE